MATLGCGAARPTSFLARQFPEAEVRTLACGTYTRVRDDAVSREGTLSGIPYLETVVGVGDPCTALPVVVILHGLGGRPIVPRWPYRDFAAPVRLLMPQGPIPWGDGGYAWSSVRTLDGEPEGLAATLSAQSDHVAAFLDALAGVYPMRGGVVLAGFSQGGILALTITMRHPEHVVLTLPLAAWVPPQLRTVPTPSTPPIRWLHGIDDERVPYELALETATDLRMRGYDVELLGYPGAHHEMTPAEEVRLHGWLVRALENLAAERPITDGFVLVP